MASLFGEGFDDPRSSAIMALAGGLMQRRGGMSLLDANNAFQAHRQALTEADTNKLKRSLLESQVNENKAQTEREVAKLQMAREAQAQQAAFLNGTGDVPAMPAQSGPSQGGMPGASAPPSAGYPQGQGAGGLIAQARALGIPEAAIKSDVLFNGGKGISDMLFKRGTPSMKVSNGYAYDENKVGAGYLPQLNVARDGQTSMVQIGADGLPIVSAPRGALETYGSYKTAEAGLKPIKVFDPATQREVFSNEAAVAGGSRPQITPSASTGYGTETAMRGQMSGGMGADPQAIQREIIATTADLRKTLDPASRAQLQAHLADLQAAGQRVQQGGGVAAGPSAAEAAMAEAEKVRAKGTAEADVKRDTGRIDDSKRFGQMMAGTQRAIDLLGQGPTNSGAGVLMDSTANFFGKSTKGAELASQLEVLAGQLTSNVPRMEGPQSDRDVQEYQRQAGAVGDRTKPVEQRIAAAKEVQRLQQKYASLNGIPGTGGATGDFGGAPKANLVDSLPKMAPKGSRARDTTTGKIKVFNGLSWTDEK